MFMECKIWTLIMRKTAFGIFSNLNCLSIGGPVQANQISDTNIVTKIQISSQALKLFELVHKTVCRSTAKINPILKFCHTDIDLGPCMVSKLPVKLLL